MPEPALSFAGLLRRLRTEARLTQEELAGEAGLSPRSVSDLERGSTEAGAHLRRALEIYQNIGAPGAGGVQDTLDEHDL